MPLTWIEHRGRKILEIDYRGLKEPEMIALLEEAAREFEKQPGGVLSVDRFEKVAVSGPFMDRAKQLGKSVIEPRRAKGAIVGQLGGFATILLEAYNLFSGGKLKPFSDFEAAKDWLVEP